MFSSFLFFLVFSLYYIHNIHSFFHSEYANSDNYTTSMLSSIFNNCLNKDIILLKIFFFFISH